LLALAIGGSCLAAQWEVGVAGGVNVFNTLSVTRASGSADAGFKAGPIVGAFLSQDLYEHLGGQFRYDFGFSDMKLSQGGTDVSFGAQTHSIHYDLLFYTSGTKASVRPYLAVGGGMRIYRGTGKEQESQPLAQYAILSKTQQIQGLLTFGGGVKAQVGHRAYLYVEVRDFMTRTPDKVIAPFTGSKISGWLHGITPMVGLSISF
jgi:hypothetical protein